MAPEKEALRPFQREVLRLIMEGKNVILQAPTGAGKTRAALAPFIKNLVGNGDALPLSCIYATPLRVLSTQFYAEYSERVTRLDTTRGTDFGRLYKRLERKPVSIQTGEQSDDAQFESLVTFCTIDQLLASLLALPYGVGRSRANMNVGAVLGSYLVLDEFHLYPLKESGESIYGARTTTLAMLAHLKDISRFILMTATFSRALLDELKILLNAEVVVVEDEDELRQIADGRQRFFRVADGAINTEALLAQHTDCSMVICNTVGRAQQTYWQLKQRANERGIEVVLLHSRLTAKDRRERSEKVMKELGKAPATWPDNTRYGWREGKYFGKNMIVVATQVVEVGLDISVRTLHTEIAPANSLIQRAGRCARFACQQGTVIVYDLPLDDAGKRVTTLPYDLSLCDATLLAVRHLDSEQPVDFRVEKALLDVVHTEEDTEMLERFKKRRESIVNEVFTSLKEHSSSAISTLIRDVAQVQILIHDNPNAAITTEPWRWQSFSMHPRSLAAHMKYLQEQKGDADWVCKEAVADVAKEDAEADTRQKTTFHWQEISYTGNQQSMEQSLRNAVIVVLPGTLATYHEDLGFLLRDERSIIPWPPTPYQSVYLGTKPQTWKAKPIEQRSYKEHIEGLIYAYNESIARQLAYVTGTLETLLELPHGTIDQAIRLAIVCHDVGKLSVQWQQWAWEWQHLLYEREGWGTYSQKPAFFFAKTDYNSTSKQQRQWQRETRTKRPNHACESVIASITILADSLGVKTHDSRYLPILRAVCAAIARHHTANAHTSEAFQLKQGAAEAVQEAFDAARQTRTWTYNTRLLKTGAMPARTLAPTTDDAMTLITLPARGRARELETWLYFVIVRALRLADQRADSFGDK